MGEENKKECCCQERVSIGKKVADFKLDTYDTAKGSFGSISLDEIKKAGKWTVLMFYPADFTFICPTELKDLGDKYADLKELGAEVISVSTDTHFSHLAWQQTEGLLKDIKYIMGADHSACVSKLFGVYDEETGLDFRGTFIIDPDGMLVSSEINFLNVGRDADALYKKLQANDYVRKNPAEVCPAKWTPGSKTLKPSEKIVGNVADALK